MKRNPRTSYNVHPRGDKGFTLVEILIAIVVVGILSAVAIVGISSLTSTGNKSACNASGDAAKAAAAAYYAGNNAYPTTIQQMITGGQYVIPTGTTASGATLSGLGWTLTMNSFSLGTFTCT